MRHLAAILMLTLFSVLMISSDSHRPSSRRPGFGCVRDWAIRTDACVLAVPDERSITPRCFKVVHVLRGEGIKPGDSIRFEGALEFKISIFDEYVSSGCKPRLVNHEEVGEVEKALIFLGPNHGTRAQPRFLRSESIICFGLQQRRVLIPPSLDCGYYVLESEPYAHWNDLVDQARLQSAEVNDLYARKNIRQIERRNWALLDWVERHRNDFDRYASGSWRDRPKGWGHLEGAIFQWVMESDDPPTSWSAIKLYAELNHGELPALLGPTFGFPKGRSLLLKIATASNVLEGHRVRALKLLSHPQTLWATSSKEHPLANSLQAEEQKDLIDQLTPLLTAQTAPLRGAAALALRCICYPEEEKRKTMRTKPALPTLVKAYRSETPGDARNELAKAVCFIGGPEHWQKLTGNPSTLLITLDQITQSQTYVQLFLNFWWRGSITCESTTLLAERLEGGNRVVETKRFPFRMTHDKLSRWSEEQSRMSMYLPEKNLRPGTWRLRVCGTVGKGKDKQSWMGEPSVFDVKPFATSDGENPQLRRFPTSTRLDR